MPATPDTIPSDLTLELGDNLAPEEFLSVMRAFFAYVKDVTEMITPAGEHIHWTVHVKEGSALIGIDPSPSSPVEVVRNIYARTESAVRSLARGDLDGAGLPESALRHLRTISDISQPSSKRRREVRLWVARKPIAIDNSIGRLIAEDWRAAYTDYGVMEGRLETIQDHGKLQIQIRDPAVGGNVTCNFPDTMLEKAFAYFRQRVEVSGLVHYRKNGKPLSIDVTQIERLPDDSELPTAAEVRGILGPPA